MDNVYRSEPLYGLDLHAKFEEAANEFGIVQTLESKHIPEVDAFEFITSPEFLSIDPRPWQSVQIKTFYSLWPYRPPTTEEENILKILKNEWQITVDLDNTSPITEMVLVDGRRAGKSALMSFIAPYEMYSLICKYDPQEYYHFIDRLPIHVLHVAAAGEQASDMFTFTKNRLRACRFFDPYFDWTKYNEAEMRLFTPCDLDENRKILAENARIPRGQPKKVLLEGSLTIESVTTRAASSRGKAIKLLIFSEFAHLDRPEFESAFIADSLAEETQQTDYAMKKALTPSVRDFGDEGRILYESSPSERGGEFYAVYCATGGVEQEHPENARRPKHMALMQLSTWQCDPKMSRESLEDEFASDPVGKNMEYGAHFGNPSGAFISEPVIQSMPQANVPMCRVCNHLDQRFVISVDPGGQAKKKVADSYVVSWGHYQIGMETLWLDGMQGWHQKVIPAGNGEFQKILVDSDEVLAFIVQLTNDIGRQYILEVVYDQWNSATAVSSLQKLGLPGLETFFTNPYKAEMYGNFLGLANTGKIKSYGIDINGSILAWQTELKYLQRYIAGGTVYYSHPSSGPCMHDDYADSVANLVYRLSMLQSPTRQSLEDRVRQNLAPTTRPRTVQPTKGGNLAYSGRSFSSFQPSKIKTRVGVR